MRVDLLVLLLLAATGSGLLLWAVPRWQRRHPDARSLRLLRVMRAGVRPLALLIPLLALRAWLQAQPAERDFPLLEHLLSLALIATLTWMAVRMVRAVRELLLEQVDISSSDNLHARKLATQFGVLERLVVGLLVFLGSAAALMTFDSVRQLGASLLASAGVAGIVIGFAARPVLSNLLAGIQIALTQPIRLEDVVIVEGEWGWIEEIKATYVVVRIWDERRLVLPLQWFIDHPFQNWTRYSSRLIGSVYWWVDYRMPLQPIRDEIKRACEGAPEWDGRLAMLQVTDSTERGIQLRALVTAPDAPRAWDLRCRVREAVIDMIQRDYPDYLPRLRTELHSSSSATEPPYPEGDGPQRLSPELHTPPPPDRPPPEA